MQVEVLSPRVEDGEEADLGAQVFGVACDGEQSLGNTAKEEIVDHVFVVEGDGGDLFGKSEDHVEVFHRQQLGGTLLQPLGARQSLAFGTVTVTARAIAD